MKHLSIKPFVSHYYLNNTLSSIYRELINPLGDHRQLPDDVLSIDILPPNVKRPVGRPKKIRTSSKNEVQEMDKMWAL